MSNVLSEAKKQQVIALGRLGWPLRRIEQKTGVRREAGGVYLKAAGIGVRPPFAWGRRLPAKPANENGVTTGSDAAKPAITVNPNPNPENLSTKGKATARPANGTGKSHLAQAIGQAAIQQGYRVFYRETHKLLDDLAEATIDGTRKEHMDLLASVPLLIIDDLGMRKLPVTAAEELLEIVMRRYERTSTLLTSNRPVEDWGKLLGDSAAVTAMLDRLLHHGHVLKCGPRSWRTKMDLPPQ
jgi:IstB-like ATP binding protein